MATAASVILSEGSRPMKSESRMQEAAARAFVTALLLAGDAERAEAAVLRGIGSTSADSECGEELIRRTVSAAIEPEELPAQPSMEREPADSTLPFELQRVLRLPRYLRQCFVLRVLVGLPSEACARLLHSKVQQIDDATCAAMSLLPGFRVTSFASHA